MNIIKIGVYLTESKKKSIAWDSFVASCEIYNNKSIIHGNYIELINITDENYDKIKFNKILAKFDEFYIEESNNEEIFLYLTLQTNLIDPVANQINVGNRLIMADKLSLVCKEFNNLFVPSYIYVTKLNYCPEITFPIICKPNNAFGCATTHSMCVVKNYTDLLKAELQLPSLFQTFHEHGGIIYKIYVVNSNVSACIKNSISIIDKDDSIFRFDTSELKNQQSRYTEEELKNFLQTIQKEIDLINLSKRIAEEFGLTLFGFDIIKINDGRYAIVDVNYFPGYNGCGSFHRHLIDYFIE